MAERKSIQIVTGDGEGAPESKMTSVRLEENGRGYMGNGRDGYSIYVNGTNGEAGASITKEAIFEALSEFFNVDITPRPEPIKSFEIGDVIEDVTVFDFENNRNLVVTDEDGDVWAYDRFSKAWAVGLKDASLTEITDMGGPFTVISVRDRLGSDEF